MSCLHDNKKDNNINMNISYIHLTLAFHIRFMLVSMYIVQSELSLRNAVGLALSWSWLSCDMSHVSVRLDGVSWWPGMEDTAECCQDARPEPNWSSSLINLHNTHRQHSRHAAADTDCHYGDLIHALILRILLLSCANHVVDMIHYESIWTFRGERNRNCPLLSFSI